MVAIVKQWIRFNLILLSVYFSAQHADSKYPDLIHETYYSQINPKFDSLYGGEGYRYPITINPEYLLGANKSWFVSLPKGSYIIFQYTDNAIQNKPHQDDIIIIENGCCRLKHQKINPEKAKVYVSADGVAYHYLGVVDDCNHNQLDLETIGFRDWVRFIKIEGLDYKCNPAGFDLMSAYALPGSNVELYTGIEHASSFFANEAEDKIMLLDRIYFKNDSFKIERAGAQDLDIVIKYLKKYPQLHIHLTGHTDSNASQEYNLKLSIRRAKAVQDYLIKHQIDAHRITIEGKGENEPLKPNTTEKGRAINRRVELRKIK